MNYDWIPLVALIISVVSLFLTLLKYFLDWRQTRLKIKVIPHDFYKYGGPDKNTFEVTLINKTMHSVSILDMVFYLKSQKAIINTKRQSVLLFTEQPSGREFYSDGFPINLGPYESKRVFIVVDGIFVIWLHDLKMTLHTNKGRKRVSIRKNSVQKREFLDM